MLIDCDPGVDDAIALLTAMARADLVGITTVNGNVGIEHTTHNALAIAQIAGVDVPVHRGAARPLIAPIMDASHTHGPTGLGSTKLPAVDRDVASEDAVGFILDMARSIDGLQLVAVGPLTNIALALRRDPTLPERLGGFTIMGGAAGVGNVTAKAEFNIWADPEAAAMVFNEFPMTTMVGLDVTHQILLGPAERDRLRAAGTPASLFAAELIDHAAAISSEARGWAGAPIHDASAVMAVLRPDLFDGRSHPVAVEVSGSLTRGMTVVDQRFDGSDRSAEGPDNAHVLFGADADQVVSEIMDAVIELQTQD